MVLIRSVLRLVGEALTELGNFLNIVSVVLITFGVIGLVLGLFDIGIIGGGGTRNLLLGGVIMAAAGLLIKVAQLVANLI